MSSRDRARFLDVRILLTAVIGGRPLDLAIDAEDDASVGDLAATIAAQAPVEAFAPRGAAHPGIEPPPPDLTVVRATPDHGGNAVSTSMGSTGAGSTSTGSSGVGTLNGASDPPRLRPTLYHGGSPIPADMPLGQSPLRHGSLVGVGAPVPDIFAEPTGLVEIRLASGPGAGGVTRLAPGDYQIGAGRSAAVRLPDIGLPDVCADLQVRVDGQVLVTAAPSLARGLQHPAERLRPLAGPIVLSTDADITERRAGESTLQELPAGTITISAEDPVPVVSLEREPVAQSTPWEPGQALVIGPCLLELTIPTAPDASLSPSPQGATLDYNRPPRLLPPQRKTEFALPQEPHRPDKQPIPWPMMMMPLVMGPVMFYFTQQPLTLLMMAMMPMMAVGNAASGRGREKKKYKRDFAEYVERTRKVQREAFTALTDERAARRRDFADPGEILMTAVGPRARLWERRRTDPDWLVARFGTADQLSSISVRSSSHADADGPGAWTAPDVPVTIALTDAGVTGIAGPARHALARWVISQLAVLHSPVEVRMMLLSEPSAEEEWSWARWLPHLRSPDDAPALAKVGVDEETTQARIGDLLRELEGRVAAAEEGRPREPMLVVLDGSRRLRLLPGMVPLLQNGPALGMFFICLDEDQRLLPEECQAVVQADEPWSIARVSTQEIIEAVRPDLVGVDWAERVARAIAPVRDVSAEDAATAIPNSSRLLDVLKLDPPSGAAIADRWERVGRSTTAVIGEGVDGIFAIDMVKDGPHGLVAGTTGSGKSELLQTIIAALAVDNRPDEMTFVLVDYKGGAAFKDCNKLPHTVGMVTDLDGHLTTRALESLGAELRRREHQLADADAKDIEDYLAAKAPEDEPMPRLLIVIDEFAALVAELPDFVTGLVDIARRGRSLGVHLILATQRPAGVVNAEIKSNTNLRIALRVTDGGDSQDVIEAGDAAEISKSTPGRAFARLGHSSLIPFQSSRVGGRPRGEGVTADVVLRPLALRSVGAEPPKKAQAEEDATTPTDLTSLVVACQEASESTGVKPPPSPWLPALDEVVTLEQVCEQFPETAPTSERLVIPLGLIDVPSQQRRGAATYSLEAGGHLAIAGAPRSGRSTVLRAFAGAVATHLSPEDVHLYGVDCGNNALLPLISMPHVGAVVKRDETDRMDRLVAQLRRVISERQQRLAEQGYADVTEQRRHSSPEERMAYVVVLFDRWEGFFQAYDPLDGGRLVQAWQQILQEGAAVGIRVVMTGDRTLTMGRMSTLLDDKLILRMTDPSDFGAIGMRPKDVPTSMPEGRGFRAEGVRETHIALLADDPGGTAQVAALHEIGKAAQERYASVPRDRRPFRVDLLPVRITGTEAAELAAREKEEGRKVPVTSLAVAVGGDTLSIRYLDAVEHGPGILIAGPRRTGRSTTLKQLGADALGKGWQVVVVTPRVSQLRSLIGQDGVHGPFDLASDSTETKELFTTLREGEAPVLTLVDDVELVGADGWLADLIVAQLEALRDSESLVAAAGSLSEMGQYRGPVAALKKAGSGVLLSPQGSQDADLFGAKLNRSVLGQPMPPGSGYLMTIGQAQRVQVILPD